MSDNKLVKAVTDAATLIGLVAGIGWIAKKVVKETFTADPSSNVMNYVKFTAVMAGSRELKHQTFLTTRTVEKPRRTGSRPSFLARTRKVKQSTFLRHGLLPVLTCLR